MLLHHFQIILNFLYVCQSVSWLTSSLKLHKSSDISSSGWYIFLKFFGDIPMIFLNYFQIIPFFVCVSVCQLAYLLTESGLTEEYVQFWMIYISEIFRRHSLDVLTLFSNNLKLFVCLTVCYLAYFLTIY